MNAARAFWAIRLAGLMLLSLAVYVFIHVEDQGNWLSNGQWLSHNLIEVVQFGSIAVIAVSFRMLVFGLRVWVRTGIILLIFVGLDMFVEYWSRRPTGDTNPYYDEGVGLVLSLYVLLPAVASLLMAAVPMFDARFRNRRVSALH